jgi:hypothetical protein
MIGGLLKSTSSAALFAAVGLFALGAGVPAAKAADLGGDCCADLEERVAELEATTARKGNRRVSLTISGQVTTALMAWDAGDAVPGENSSDVYVVDNVMAGGSFFALSGSAKINPSLTAGFNITVAFDTGGRSHQVSAADDDGQPAVPTASAAGQAALVGGFDTFIVVSLANWYLDHSQLGRITVGRANMATAGITTIDLGGAGVIANASIGYAQRGFTDPESGQTWANLLGGNTVNGASLARGNVINYTSPTMGGFSVSGSWGENDVWDVALRYAGEFSGFRIAAGIGYIQNSGGLGDLSEESGGATTCAANAGCEPSAIKGSASVLHVASGLFVTSAYLVQDNDTPNREDTALWYLQGGIAKNWTGLGNTVLYGEYARVWNALDNFGRSNALTIPDTDSTMWGVGVVQHIDAAAMELFLAYKNFSAESPNEDFGEFDVVIGGARIRF